MDIFFLPTCQISSQLCGVIRHSDIMTVETKFSSSLFHVICYFFPNLFWKSTLDFKSNYEISCFSCCSVQVESINTSSKVVIDSNVCSCSVFGLVNARCHCTGCETINDFSDCNFADKVMFLPNLKSRSWNVLFLCNLPSQGYRFWWSESKTDSFSFFHLFTIAFKRNPNSGIVELIYVLDEIYTDDIDQKYRTRFFPVSISFRH